MVDLTKLNEELDRILAGQEASRKEMEERRTMREKARLVSYGLKETEAESWLSEEPDFRKPIFRR